MTLPAEPGTAADGLPAPRQAGAAGDVGYLCQDRWHHAGPPPVTHPDFGSYATLKCGIEYERQRIAWLRWMVEQFTSHLAADGR